MRHVPDRHDAPDDDGHFRPGMRSVVVVVVVVVNVVVGAVVDVALVLVVVVVVDNVEVVVKVVVEMLVVVVVVLVVGVCVDVDGGLGLSMQTLWYEFFESLAFMFELNWMPSPPEKHPGGL